MLDSKDLDMVPVLASVMIHEFKNPMSLIQAEIEYIELGDKDKKYSKNFRVIHREIARANEMVTGWISGLEWPRQLQDKICVHDEIMECVNYFLPMMNKSIAFHMNCEDPTVQVLGNQKLFGIAISNTIKNSIEAIEKEGAIEASIRKENNQIVIVIKDNGVGIPEDVVAKVQGEESYTNKLYGSGVGVNSSRTYAYENRGTYHIENGNNGGCVVTMTFPAI